jgi:DNA polymerase III gamma/tau subunit
MSPILTKYFPLVDMIYIDDKSNNKITELRTIFQRD